MQQLIDLLLIDLLIGERYERCNANQSTFKTANIRGDACGKIVEQRMINIQLELFRLFPEYGGAGFRIGFTQLRNETPFKNGK